MHQLQRIRDGRTTNMEGRPGSRESLRGAGGTALGRCRAVGMHIPCWVCPPITPRTAPLGSLSHWDGGQKAGAFSHVPLSPPSLTTSLIS